MSDDTVIPFPNANPWSSRGLDPDVVDADTFTQYEAETILAHRSFATAQGWMALFTNVETIFTSVSVNWHDTNVDVNDGSFAVVQTGSRLADLVGEIVRIAVGTRSVYAYVVSESTVIPTEVTLTKRAFLALGLWAQHKAGLQSKLEVMV